MIFWKLFFIFLRIGIFSFGGGLAMIALIQNEVVEKQGWLTAQEFADVVATSQITPGPVGINTATYTGYTAVVNAGYPEWLGVLGALLASVSVILLPLLLMMLVWHLLMKHKANPIIASIMSVIRLAVVGMIAAAALLMITPTRSVPTKHRLCNILSASPYLCPCLWPLSSSKSAPSYSSC